MEPKATGPGSNTERQPAASESSEQSLLSPRPRLPGTTLPRSAGLLLVVGAILVIEVLRILGLAIPAPVAILLLAVASAAYLDGMRTGLIGAVLAVLYVFYNFVGRGEVLGDASIPALRVMGFVALTIVVVVFVGRFRTRLDALLLAERRVLEEAESKREELASALNSAQRAQYAVRLQARLLDAVGQAVIATDVNGRILYWNESAAALFGKSAKDVVRRPITDIMPDRSEREDTLRRIRRGASFSGEFEVDRGNDPPVTVMYSDSPIRDDAGHTMGMVRIATDVTARKHEERVQRLLADAGAALASSLDYETTIRNVARLCVPTFADCCLVDVVEVDGTTRHLEAAHIDAGREAEVRQAQSEYTLDSASGHLFAEVLSTGMLRYLPRITEATLRKGHDQGHARFLRRLGFRSAIIAPLRAGGVSLGVISFYRGPDSVAYEEVDLLLAEELANRAANAIQQSRLLESALIADRAKSDFLAVMSHELRTPLTTVTGYTDLLLADVPEALPEPHRAYVLRIRLAATHLLSLIEQILVFARLELDREKVQPERVRVADVLGDAADLVEPVATEQGIRFRVDAPGSDLFIETDTTKLRQILLNLLANAVKFTEEGEVSLSASERDGEVVFTVGDTGVGIAPEHLDSIFDAFWQVDQSSTRRAGGAGLGLSVTRRLARVLGGDVSVESEAGSGTSFHVRLPVRWSLDNTEIGAAGRA